MATHSAGRGRAAGLRGRRSELSLLDGVVDAVRAGESRALVVTGEPGVGKTALLEYLAGSASGCRVVRAAGVQPEMELAFAGLQQLCAPVLDHLERLPIPQRDALRIVLGVSAGPAPDRFLVGLAALSLLSEVAEERPLVCLVDDQQWLDRVSAQVLGFVARRLAAESVGLVFAARKPTGDVAGLPELPVGGLGEGDARALLDSALTGPLDERVRDRIVAETRGNPLALLELVRGLTPAELAGGFGFPGAAPLSGGIEKAFRRRGGALPAGTRLLLLVAAADPTGDPGLVWGAAGRLGIDTEAAPPPHSPRAADLLLDGLAVHFTEGYSAGLPVLQQALSAFGSGMSTAEELRWLWLASVVALHLWDDHRWDVLSRRYVELAREAGALSELPLALSSRTYLLLFAGELSAAASLVEEVRVATEATGSSVTPYGALGLAALRGREAEASALIEATREEAALRGEGIGITVAEWANAVLYNGLGRYQHALAAAQQATEYPEDLGSPNWAVVELIEASARSGARETATAAHRRLLEMTRVSGTDWALGVEARSRALLLEGDRAETLYRESIGRLGRTRVRAELARAHLLYGEWLRRERRRADAREQLRTAYDMLDAMGIGAFAERARRELAATGETARRRTVETSTELTAQEARIARLARDGLSNPEIGVRLFISARTVQYHLRQVFTKLGIVSRSQLDRVLPSDPATAQPQ